MVHKEYTVGYYDADGNLQLAFKTPTTFPQARRRLDKVNKEGGVVDLVWDDETGRIKDKVKRQAFIVSREISDWKRDDVHTSVSVSRSTDVVGDQRRMK